MAEIKKIDNSIVDKVIDEVNSQTQKHKDSSSSASSKINSPKTEEMEFSSNKKESIYTKNENGKIIEYHEYEDGSYTKDYTDNNGNRVIERYDEYGKITNTRTIAENGHESVKYDDNSSQKQYINNDGQKVIEQYDDNGNLLTKQTNYEDGSHTEQYSGENSETIIKRYDSEGNETNTRVINSDGTESVSYNNLIEGFFNGAVDVISDFGNAFATGASELASIRSIDDLNTFLDHCGATVSTTLSNTGEAIMKFGENIKDGIEGAFANTSATQLEMYGALDPSERDIALNEVAQNIAVDQTGEYWQNYWNSDEGKKVDENSYIKHDGAFSGFQKGATTMGLYIASSITPVGWAASVSAVSGESYEHSLNNGGTLNDAIVEAAPAAVIDLGLNVVGGHTVGKIITDKVKSGAQSAYQAISNGFQRISDGIKGLSPALENIAATTKATIGNFQNAITDQRLYSRAPSLGLFDNLFGKGKQNINGIQNVGDGIEASSKGYHSIEAANKRVEELLSNQSFVERYKGDLQSHARAFGDDEAAYQAWVREYEQLSNDLGYNGIKDSIESSHYNPTSSEINYRNQVEAEMKAQKEAEAAERARQSDEIRAYNNQAMNKVTKPGELKTIDEKMSRINELENDGIFQSRYGYESPSGKEVIEPVYLAQKEEYERLLSEVLDDTGLSEAFSVVEKWGADRNQSNYLDTILDHYEKYGWESVKKYITRNKGGNVNPNEIFRQYTPEQLKSLHELAKIRGSQTAKYPTTFSESAKNTAQKFKRIIIDDAQKTYSVAPSVRVFGKLMDKVEKILKREKSGINAVDSEIKAAKQVPDVPTEFSSSIEAAKELGDSKQFLYLKLEEKAQSNPELAKELQDYKNDFLYKHYHDISPADLSEESLYKMASKYLPDSDLVMYSNVRVSGNKLYGYRTEFSQHEKDIIFLNTKNMGSAVNDCLRTPEGFQVRTTTGYEYWDYQKLDGHLKAMAGFYQLGKIDLHDIIKTYDDILDRSILTEDIVSYSGVQKVHDGIKELELSEIKVGMEITDDGYRSSSLVKGYEYGGTTHIQDRDFPYVLKITTPKGFKAAYIESASGLQDYAYQELIHSRGTKLKITKNPYEDPDAPGRWIVECEVTHQPPTTTLSTLGIGSKGSSKYYERYFTNIDDSVSLEEFDSFMSENGLLAQIDNDFLDIESKGFYSGNNSVMGEHGIDHVKRVTTYALYMGKRSGLSDSQMTLLRKAVEFHDVGIASNSGHVGHAQEGANRMRSEILVSDSSLSQDDKNIIAALIEYHEMPDSVANLTTVLNKYNISEYTEYFKEMSDVLKDADAIDRVRFPGNLDTSYFRNQELSESLVQTACEIQEARGKEYLEKAATLGDNYAKYISDMRAKGISDYEISFKLQYGNQYKIQGVDF